MTTTTKLDCLALLPDGDERLRFLIDLGRQLPPLQESEQTEENLVRGCVSSVWLLCETNRTGNGGSEITTLHFRGQSDALIVTGIAVNCAITIYGTQS